MNNRPTLLVTGASGFIGRHVVAALQQRYFIHALARRSAREARAPESENIRWHQVDIGDSAALARTFATITDSGGVDYVLHLAAYYDFSGDDTPEYERTNVEGLRNVLDLCGGLEPKRFIFASSLAASEFPAAGTVLNERSPRGVRGPPRRSHPDAETTGEGRHARHGPRRTAARRTPLREAVDGRLSRPGDAGGHRLHAPTPRMVAQPPLLHPASHALVLERAKHLLGT